MQVTFGLLTVTDPYVAAIPDTMTDGLEQSAVVFVDGIGRTVQWSANKNLPIENGQVFKGTLSGATGPVANYLQEGTTGLDLDPLALPKLVTGDSSWGTGSASAAFTITPNPAVAGQAVTFDGSASTVTGDLDCLNPSKTMDWDLDGNGEIDVRGTVVTETYGDPGGIPVTLRVTSGCGPVDVTTHLLVIEPSVATTDVDLPDVDFLYWTLAHGLVWTSIDSTEATAGLQALAAHIDPYEDYLSLPRLRLSAPVTAGNIQNGEHRAQTTYYGTGSIEMVNFEYAGAFAADSESIDEDSAFVTRASTTGVTVTCVGVLDDIASLRSEAASIAASVTILTL